MSLCPSRKKSVDGLQCELETGHADQHQCTIKDKVFKWGKKGRLMSPTKQWTDFVEACLGFASTADMTAHHIARRISWEIRCPKCGQSDGESCVTKRLRERTSMHASRMTKAKRILMGRKEV